ncbi:hypothetical protein ACI7BZ_12345 [Xanthobacter sp. AM11]|uniref:hypothetical protein n=1 Tax=Xanthobacter sp. AM11 TaxID=3380643 RepID=UPI0039BF7511
MIEQIMYFSLGVLLATLVALLVLPAVWHRAVRLTTRRVEAAVPISIFEVQADKDQQRAFFALNQRRLELQTDAMRDAVVAHAATIETQRQRIFELEGDLAELRTRHDLAQATGAERDVVLGEIQDQLADRTAAMEQLEAAFAERGAALAALEEAHRRLQAQAQELAATLKTLEATLAGDRARIAALEAERAALTASLAGTARQLDETSAMLEAERAAAAEARATAATAATRLATDLSEAQAALAHKAGESDARAEAIAALEAARDQLAADLATARADLDSNRAVVHAFEQRRATEFATAEAENRRLADTLHMLKADHALMEEAVRRPRRDTETPAGELLTPETVTALRESLAEVAARLVALATRMEGDASPVPAFVADGGPGSLATRIRTLLEAEAPPAPPTRADAAVEAQADAAQADKRARAVAR